MRVDDSSGEATLSAGQDPPDGKPKATGSQRLANWMERRSGYLIAAAVLATALLVLPFLMMRPDQTASADPGGEVFDALALADKRFASQVFVISLIVEARDGDLLRREPLIELLKNSEALRTDPEIAPLLYSHFDVELGIEIDGLYTIADAVEARLKAGGVGGLAAADEQQVKAATAEVLEASGSFAFGLSAQTRRDSAGEWVAPAVITRVLADNAALGGGTQAIRLNSGSPRKEEFAREVQNALRGGQSHLLVWGVAIDLNLTVEEQGAVAGPFIGFTILAVLLVVGLTFRSYWAVAITGAALAASVIWLKGLANLFGLKSDLVLDLIVPIAMISFGVDFAVHGIARYREERHAGKPPRFAFVVGLGGVLAALMLALVTDSIAFLTNVVSGIESVTQFGIGAVLGLVSAFLLLGVATPLALMKVETKHGRWANSRRRTFFAANAAVLAGAVVTASVLFSVFVIPWVGVLILAVYLVAFLGVPFAMAGRGNDTEAQKGPAGPNERRASDTLGRIIVGFARRRSVLLPAVLGLTAAAAFFALRFPVEFEASDFLSAETDFVIGLDKLREHGGSERGEPATVYVEGDLTARESLAALSQFAASVRNIDSEGLARYAEGGTRIETGVLAVVEEVMRSPAARSMVSAETGVGMTDSDGDGRPDSAEQLAALYAFTRRAGVTIDGFRTLRTPDQVRTVLWISDSGALQATKLELQLVGTGAQENIAQVRRELEPLVGNLKAALQRVDPTSMAVLTGGPIVRQSGLDAVSRALQVSVPIAAILLLIVAAAAMRSVRYALATITPVLLVVVWLYAFMFAFGFAINLVTATIGAISIGIGVDFAIHFTMRYREELRRHATNHEALRAAGSGTGGALLASALSSVVGFAILAFAPMPLFAAYGLLTAVMIAMALASSLLVLPSILILVTNAPGTIPDGHASAVRPTNLSSTGEGPLGQTG